MKKKEQVEVVEPEVVEEEREALLRQLRRERRIEAALSARDRRLDLPCGDRRHRVEI